MLYDQPGAGGQQSNIANFQFIESGTLVGVQCLIIPVSTLAADDVGSYQLSFSAVVQQSNDVRGDIVANFGYSHALTTSGASTFGVNFYMPVGIKVSGEARLYLHAIDAVQSDQIYVTAYMN